MLKLYFQFCALPTELLQSMNYSLAITLVYHYTTNASLFLFETNSVIEITLSWR